MGAAEGGISPDKIRLFIVIEFAIYLFSPPGCAIVYSDRVPGKISSKH